MGKKAAEALGLQKNGDLSGKTVFIKPNLVSFGLGLPVDPLTGEWTKAEIVVGIAEQCLEAGAARVTIGDGAQGLEWDWNSVALLPGEYDLHRRRTLKEAVDLLKTRFPLQVIELQCLNAVNEWEHIPSSSDHETRMFSGSRSPGAFYEADHVISVPVLKTHTLRRHDLFDEELCGGYASVPPYVNSGNPLVRSNLHQGL